MQLSKTSNKSRIWFGALALILVISMLSACGKKDTAAPGSSTSPATSGDVAATYKDGKVTQGELTSFINATQFFYPQFASAAEDPQFKDYMLKQMVALKVLTERASDTSKKEGETKTQEQIKQIKDYFEGQEKGAWDKQLTANKVTEKEVQSYVQTSLTAMSDANSKVTDQQTKESYDKKLKTDPHMFDIATVSHILIALKDPNDTTGQKDLRTKDEALARAKEAKSKLDKGGDFAALAKEYSDDPGSKDKGGTYQNEALATTQWDPVFKKAATDLPVNQVSDPIETSFGYHIMKVNARDAQPYDKVKDSIKSEIAQGMVTEFITNELPKLDFKSNLPQPSPSAAPASPNASAAPGSPAASASPAASPAATSK